MAAWGGPPSSGLPGPTPAGNGGMRAGGAGAEEPMELLGSTCSQRAQFCMQIGGPCRGVGALPPSSVAAMGSGSLCQCGVAGQEQLALQGQPVSYLLWPKRCPEPCQQWEPCCHPAVHPSCLSTYQDCGSQLLLGPSWGCCHQGRAVVALSQGPFLLLTLCLAACSCRPEER